MDALGIANQRYYMVDYSPHRRIGHDTAQSSQCLCSLMPDKRNVVLDRLDDCREQVMQADVQISR